MNGSFNGKILVDKLAKLNNSQQSIETLSHWCIFHRNKAKQVVETWEQQFQCSPREQRISFLYLANDILQNSRRKGLEFINEFWKVLPNALIDVFGNGGDSGRTTVLRLVDIWEERKVFGSRGQFLKEEILGRKLDSRNKIGKPINHNPKKFSGTLMEKIISSYDQIQDEDGLFGKCESAINIIDNIEKELGNDNKIGNINQSEGIGELQIQHDLLGKCTEQLKAAELSRATLISNLTEALKEQVIHWQIFCLLELLYLLIYSSFSIDGHNYTFPFASFIIFRKQSLNKFVNNFRLLNRDTRKLVLFQHRSIVNNLQSHRTQGTLHQLFLKSLLVLSLKLLLALQVKPL
ncbi:hypothetical protein Cni_G13113 [Canna indica]|uniref:CID domain-containing protein n=1 Tax=Canna indica TaxID=4628 RepID=A0AAQ3K9P4_9LILI|nr:hypothetical protein Cni_G13113 [Canna indica]